MRDEDVTRITRRAANSQRHTFMGILSSTAQCARMGELLLSWTGQYSLSCCKWLRDDEAASMVANETQALRMCKRDVPGYTSLWSLGSCSSGQTDTQLSVGESVSLLREPDAGDPPVRFDERDVETEGKPSEAPADERAGNR
jgi:hypothetical protein